MVDVHAAILAFLEDDATLVAAAPGGIFAARDVPPPGYKPDDGAAITFRVRGGTPDYDDATLMPSVQFKCYGASELAAWTCYRTLYDTLHNGVSATIARGISEVLGQPLEEPDTDWPFVLAFFRVLIRQS